MVLGDPIGTGLYLTQIDIDNPKYFKYFKDIETLIIQTGKGYHVYIQSQKAPGTRKDYPITGIEIRGQQGSYAVIPPSIHPETKNEYTVYRDHEILKVKDAIRFTEEKLGELKGLFRRQHNQGFDTTDRNLDITEIDDIFHLLQPYYKESYRNEITLALAGLLRKKGISHESAVRMIERFLDIDDDPSNRLDALDRTYKKEVNDKKLIGITGIEKVIESQGHGEDVIREVSIELKKIINPPRYWGEITFDIATNRKVVVNPNTGTTEIENIRKLNNDEISTREILINAYLKELIVYDSPIEGEVRKFETVWKSHNSPRDIRIGPDLAEEIGNYLRDSGYIVSTKKYQDGVLGSFHAFIDSGIATLKTDIENPGFFYDSKTSKILNVKYDVPEQIRRDDILEAMGVLDQLGEWYDNQRDKLATVIKWGMIAPFIYTKKQMGEWIPWLYLYGKAKSGKTTMGHIALSLYQKRDDENDISGSHFDTVARVGHGISRSTFPIVVNEPAGTFQRISVVDMLKSSIERVVGRGKYEGRSFRNIPSFAPVIFTANQHIPDDDAILRRLLLLSFTHNEKKEDAEVERFIHEFQINNRDKTSLNKLQAIGIYTAREIIGNPELLEMNWQDMVDHILRELYAAAGVGIPSWLTLWCESESMEEMDDEHREDIRIFLQEKINKAYGQVKVYDEDNRPVTLDVETSYGVKGSDDFRHRVWTVANERLIPWMIPVDIRGVDYICLTSGFRKSLQNELKLCENLKSTAQLLGWKYQSVRLEPVQKVIKVRFDKFLGFIFNMEVGE